MAGTHRYSPWYLGRRSMEKCVSALRDVPLEMLGRLRHFAEEVEL
jgi:hypothetical protein